MLEFLQETLTAGAAATTLRVYVAAIAAQRELDEIPPGETSDGLRLYAWTRLYASHGLARFAPRQFLLGTYQSSSKVWWRPLSSPSSQLQSGYWLIIPLSVCGSLMLQKIHHCAHTKEKQNHMLEWLEARCSDPHLQQVFWEALSSSAFTSLRISHGLLTQMQCWRRHISVSSSWDGWGSLERAPESSGPSTPALWRASWPAVSPPGLETAPLATAGLCKGSCELPATLLEVSFPPSRISTPGGVQGKPGGLSKTPATRPTDCSLCCPQGDVSTASDPALADWGTAFSLRLSG